MSRSGVLRTRYCASPDDCISSAFDASFLIFSFRCSHHLFCDWPSACVEMLWQDGGQTNS